MAKRYGIFPVVFDQEDSAYRSAVAEVPNCSSSSLIPTHPVGHPEEGHPVWGFALSIFSTPNLAATAQLSNCYIFPDYSLDATLEGMEVGERTALKQSVEAYDLDGEGEHLEVDISNLSISYRQLLTSIYLQLDPLLSPAAFNNFDCGSL